MSATESTIFWIYFGLVAIWPIRLVVLGWILGRQEFLDGRSPRFEGPDAPRVTAILPCKDEANYVGNCLASVIGQDYPELEIIVVDDRSRDGTGEIARRIAETDSRVRVETIQDLPAGWTGKTHAMHHAAGLATGEWLWFFDADTLHEPDGLSILMQYGRATGRGHGQPAARAAVRDILGAGRPAAGRDRADAVVPAERRPPRQLAAGVRQWPVHPDPARGL